MRTSLSFDVSIRHVESNGRSCITERCHYACNEQQRRLTPLDCRPGAVHVEERALFGGPPAKGTDASPLGIFPCAAAFNGTAAVVSIAIPQACNLAPAPSGTVLQVPLLQGYLMASKHLQKKVVSAADLAHSNVSLLQFIDLSSLSRQQNTLLRDRRTGVLLMPQELLCPYTPRRGGSDASRRSSLRRHGPVWKRRRVVVLPALDGEYELTAVNLGEVR